MGFTLGRVGYDKMSASSLKSLAECSRSISVLDRKTE